MFLLIALNHGQYTKVEDYGPPPMKISWGICTSAREARRKFMGDFHGGFGFEKMTLSKFHGGFSWGISIFFGEHVMGGGHNLAPC